MARRYFGALAVGLALAACSDRPPTLAEPENHGLAADKPTPPPGEECDFGVIKSQINTYLATPHQQTAQALADEMEAASSASTINERGFDVLRVISEATNQGVNQGTALQGSDLTNNVLVCMSFGTNAPALPIDFEASLTPTTGGAFYVRGGLGDGTTPAIGTSGTVNLSAIAPPAPPTTSIDFAWRNTATGTAPRNGILDERVLIYGFATDDGYDWSLVQPNATFNPFAVVALCNPSSSLSTMVHESGVGVLAYDEATADDICDDPKPLSLRERANPFALLRRFARMGASLVAPEPLHAVATVVGTKSTGGTATGAKSEFTTEAVEVVRFEFVIPLPPKKIFLSQDPVPIRVRATSLLNGVKTGVNGTCVYVTGSENNGTNTALIGTHECDNEPAGAISAITKSLTDGTAGYADLVVNGTKAGGLTLTASSEDASGNTGVIGRDGQVFINGTAKTSINP